MGAPLAERFLQSFVLPLVAGGELHVGRPLDGEDLQELRDATVTSSDLQVQIWALRQRRAQEIWLYPVDLPLDEQALSLAVGLHNLLFLGHPERQRRMVRDSALARLLRFTEGCLQVGPPATEADLVARHTLLAAVPDLVRTDVEVRFWAGSRRFVGRAPPQRLLRWPQLRRVREHRELVLWVGSDLDDSERRLVEILLRQSPLTDLLSLTRPAPPVRWERLLPYLASQRVSRTVCHRYIASGLGEVGPALARSFWQLAERYLRAEVEDPAHARAALRTVAELVRYLLVASCLTEAPEIGGAEPREMLGGVLVAAIDAGILERSGEEHGALLDDRFDELVAQIRGDLGESAKELVGLIERVFD